MLVLLPNQKKVIDIAEKTDRVCAILAVHVKTKDLQKRQERLNAVIRLNLKLKFKRLCWILEALTKAELKKFKMAYN